jgi:hypothetical protein
MWLPTVDFESTASAVSPPRHEVSMCALISYGKRFRREYHPAVALLWLNRRW